MSLGDGSANVFDTGEHSVEGDEMSARRVSDDARQGCFTCTRWAVKDQATELIGLNGASQQSPMSDDMLLADVLIQRARTHTRSQWRFLLQPFFVCLIEEVHSTGYYTPEKLFDGKVE